MSATANIPTQPACRVLRFNSLWLIWPIFGAGMAFFGTLIYGNYQVFPINTGFVLFAVGIGAGVALLVWLLVARYRRKLQAGQVSGHFFMPFVSVIPVIFSQAIVPSVGMMVFRSDAPDARDHIGRDALRLQAGMIAMCSCVFFCWVALMIHQWREKRTQQRLAASAETATTVTP